MCFQINSAWWKFSLLLAADNRTDNFFLTSQSTACQGLLLAPFWIETRPWGGGCQRAFQNLHVLGISDDCYIEVVVCADEPACSITCLLHQPFHEPVGF